MTKASERAYGHIRTMVLSGELKPGDQIIEEQLAEICGVSRTPVREALRRLESEKFIYRSDSKRSYVSQWTVEDVEDAFELRSMLEAYAAKRAATRLTEEKLNKLRYHNRKIEAAIQQTPPDVPTFLEHNRMLHEIILAAADSPALSAMLPQIVEQPVVLRTALHYDLENLQRSHHEHAELLAAFDRRDGDWAASIMTGHIRRAFHAYSDAHDRDRQENRDAA
ncbi:GntR family transcriptional regulator [Sphingorhabdus arenilitoris]|uniref:GntR family transcriptional regulator n=1 Tax=Sphingorhabdus arenilitoris TaxID=1490041 RepID=A0ABV8RGD9_9SPHN